MSAFRRVWWWLTGASICFANCPHNRGAWCKRRDGHRGKHRTSSGFEWPKETP